MSSTAVAPNNAAQAAYTSSGTSNTNSTNSSNSTNSTNSTSSSSAAQLSLNNGLASLADNFQGFLTLLTTQLKNQDPTQPLDTNQFTQQITQMTGVEQQLLSNQLLQQLVSNQGGVAQAANMIGETITAPGATDTDPAINGVVTSVSSVDGQTMLNVGGTQVPLDSITSVSWGANSPSSTSGS
jgi:flagellar basal-body rod modification protein FlgD